MNPAPEAVEFLIENFSKISWLYFSTNPTAIKYIKKYRDHIYWEYLSVNPAAIDMIETKKHLISWILIGNNKNIFEYDYKSMKEIRLPIKEEMIQKGIIRIEDV
jgi:hypothetical protein